MLTDGEREILAELNADAVAAILADARDDAREFGGMTDEQEEVLLDAIGADRDALHAYYAALAQADADDQRRITANLADDADLPF